MQTIFTKFLGCTNTKGERVKAKQSASYGGTPVSVTVPWQYELSAEDNHAAAAMTLANKLGWHGKWIGGDNGMSGYVFVNSDPTAYGPKFTSFNKESE